MLIALLNSFNKLKYKNTIIVFSITIIYSLLSFIHFGSIYRYQDNVTLTTPGTHITIIFNKETKLKSFYYATSYLKGNYNIQAFDDLNHNLVIDDKDAKLGYSPYFRWNMIDLSNKNNIKNITIELNNGIMNLSNIVLLDQNNNLVTDYQIVSNFNLSEGNLDKLRVSFIPNLDDNYLTSTIFDEIYYTTSAYQYLHNISPDVWVHPQLSILSIAGALYLFGTSAFAWRIIPAILSILLIPLLYLFARAIFKSSKLSIIATLLLCFEFMHFTLGRYASIEPFVTFFLVCEYYFLYKYLDLRMHNISYSKAVINLFLAGICFGLAIASKWSALYSTLMILVIFIYSELIRHKNSLLTIIKIIFLGILQFVLIPLSIYCLTYIPFALINNYQSFFSQVYQLQKWMLNFNLGLTHAIHPYASNYWSWPLDFKPLSIYYWQNLPFSSSVVVMGNPLIFWLFFPVVLFLLYTLIKDKKDYKALFLLGSLTLGYLPYALITRISFIYYFYTVVPFLILSITYLIDKLFKLNNKKSTVGVYAYIFGVVLLFILFYPAISGVHFYRDYSTHVLLWFPSWNF